MNYRLISERNPHYDMIEQVLVNRGIQPEEIEHYLNTNDDDILNPSLIANMDEGIKMLVSHLSASHPIFLIIDSDCDGYTSSALLLNYLYCSFPASVINNFTYALHDGKQHGINLDLIPEGTKLVICPDSGRLNTACIYLFR